MSIDPTAIEIQSDHETDPFKAIMEGTRDRIPDSGRIDPCFRGPES